MVEDRSVNSSSPVRDEVFVPEVKSAEEAMLSTSKKRRQWTPEEKTNII